MTDSLLTPFGIPATGYSTMLLTCQFVSKGGRAMLETGKSQSESMLLHTMTLLSVFFAIMMTIPR
jgi:hypothetical protein